VDELTKHRGRVVLAPDHREVGHRAFVKRTIDDAGGTQNPERGRHDRDAGSRRHETQGVRLRALLNHAWPEPGGATDREDLVVKARTPRSCGKYERLTREHLKLKAAVATQSVAGRQGGDERFLVHGRRGQCRLVDRSPREAHVDARCHQIFDLPCRVHLLQPHLEVRRSSSERADDVRQVAHGNGRDVADPEHAVRAALCEARVLDGAIDLREEASRVVEKHEPSGRQSNMATVALEELQAELSLQVPNLTTERRLCDVDAGGGATEVQLLTHRDEVAEVASSMIPGRYHRPKHKVLDAADETAHGPSGMTDVSERLLRGPRRRTGREP
jgi:hypothetical protein